MPPQEMFGFRSSEIDSDTIWANLGGKIALNFHLFFYNKEL